MIFRGRRLGRLLIGIDREKYTSRAVSTREDNRGPFGADRHEDIQAESYPDMELGEMRPGAADASTCMKREVVSAVSSALRT